MGTLQPDPYPIFLVFWEVAAEIDVCERAYIYIYIYIYITFYWISVRKYIWLFAAFEDVVLRVGKNSTKAYEQVSIILWSLLSQFWFEKTIFLYRFFPVSIVMKETWFNYQINSPPLRLKIFIFNPFNPKTLTTDSLTALGSGLEKYLQK